MLALNIFGLCASLFCAIYFFMRTRANPLRSLGALTIIAIYFYHGLPEVLNALFPGYNIYRQNVAPDIAVYASTFACLGMIVFTVAYLLHHNRTVKMVSVERWIDVLPDGGFLTVIGVATIWLTYLGGELSPSSITGQIVKYSAIPLAALWIVRVAATWGRRTRPLFIILLLVLMVIVAAQASRWLILFSLALPIGLAQYTGVYRKNDVATIVFTVGLFLALVVTIARANLGYEFFQGNKAESTTARIAALRTVDNEKEALLQGLVYRCDGNSTIAHMLKHFMNGGDTVLPEMARGLMTLIVPRILYPNKPGEGEELLMREKAIFAYSFNFPPLDNIVTTLGAVLGYFGVWAFMPLMYVWGFAVARIDGWLERRHSLGSLLLFVYFYWCICIFEQGIESYFLIGRNFLPIVGLFYVYNKVRAVFIPPRPVESWGQRRGVVRLDNAAQPPSMRPFEPQRKPRRFTNGGS